MKDIKYISIINFDVEFYGGDNRLEYGKNIGDILNIIYDYIIIDSEDEHILALEDSVISERIQDMGLVVEIYRIGDHEPFAILDSDTVNFHNFVDEMFGIEERSDIKSSGDKKDKKNETFSTVLKFEKFKNLKESKRL